MGGDGYGHTTSVGRRGRWGLRRRVHAERYAATTPSVIHKECAGCATAWWIVTRWVIALGVCGVPSACAINGMGTSLRREYDAGALRIVEWRSAGVIVWVTPEERSVSIGVQRRWAAYALRHDDRRGGGRERDRDHSACCVCVAHDVGAPSDSAVASRGLVAMGRDALGACAVMRSDAVGVGLGLMKWVGVYAPVWEEGSRANGQHDIACTCGGDCVQRVLLVSLDGASAEGCGGAWVAVDGVYSEGE